MEKIQFNLAPLPNSNSNFEPVFESKFDHYSDHNVRFTLGRALANFEASSASFSLNRRKLLATSALVLSAQVCHSKLPVACKGKKCY